jgi:hypothetical protein
MESSSIEVKVSRTDRIYRPNEMCEGTVTVNVYKGWSHNGLLMLAEGYIQTVVPNSGIAVNSEAEDKAIIFAQEQELSPKGYFNDGVVEIPFKFQVTQDKYSNNAILESYHGVYISIIYHILVTCDRGMMKKTLKKDLEFVVEIPQESQGGKGLSFDISPSKLVNVDPKILRNIPNFTINGKVHRTNCNINQPFTGEVKVDMSVATIKSLELQLVRVESIDNKGTGQFFKEATEIQLLQIGEGNVCRGLVVPMYMVFPRLFSCPTVRSGRFKIEFEINLLIVFGDGHLITENFPIEIGRYD